MTCVHMSKEHSYKKLLLPGRYKREVKECQEGGDHFRQGGPDRCHGGGSLKDGLQRTTEIQ